MYFKEKPNDASEMRAVRYWTDSKGNNRIFTLPASFLWILTAKDWLKFSRENNLATEYGLTGCGITREGNQIIMCRTKERRQLNKTNKRRFQIYLFDYIIHCIVDFVNMVWKSFCFLCNSNNFDTCRLTLKYINEHIFVKKCNIF